MNNAIVFGYTALFTFGIFDNKRDSEECEPSPWLSAKIKCKTWRHQSFLYKFLDWGNSSGSKMLAPRA